MDDKAQNDLLIRIDQKVTSMEKALFEAPTYPTIKEKVLTHGKILWGILFISLSAIIKAFWK